MALLATSIANKYIKKNEVYSHSLNLVIRKSEFESQHGMIIKGHAIFAQLVLYLLPVITSIVKSASSNS